MVDERRRSPRARIAGARVRFEGASGKGVTARALDLAKGGLFVETERPLPVGKRLSLEIHIGGELAPWPALGRVVWLREAGAPGNRPPGMGVAFIALDDAVIGAIDRVLRPLLARQAAEGGTGAPRSAPPRERTELGVGPSTRSAPPTAPVIPTAPVVMAAPAREETLLGVGAGRAQAMTLPGDLDDAKAWEVDEPPTVQADRPVAPPKPETARPAPVTEQSVAIDLVARRLSSRPVAAETDREASLAPAGVPRRGRMRWPLVLLVVASASAGYAFRARLRPLIAPYVSKALALIAPTVENPGPPPAVTSAAPVPSARAPEAPTAAPASSPALSASKAVGGMTNGGAPSAAQSASASGAKAPPPRRPAPPPPPTPAPSATGQSGTDNPY